jgi:hypothetical protein
MDKGWRVATKESWGLKLDRAEQHLKEFDAAAATFAVRHPYVVERVVQPKRQRHIWLYRLRFTEQPDPMMAVVLGDVIENMRSCLDHIRCGLVPRRRRNKLLYFPAESVDPWERTGRKFVVRDPKVRSRYLSAVEGMAVQAKAIVEEMQPYQVGPKERHVHPLAVLNSLNNADKHRRLIVLALGLDEAVSTTKVRGDIINQTVPGFAVDGSEVAKFGFPGRPEPTESEVEVTVSGTPRIAVDVGLRNKYPEASQMLWHILAELRSTVGDLEPFVIP